MIRERERKGKGGEVAFNELKNYYLCIKIISSWQPLKDALDSFSI